MKKGLYHPLNEKGFTLLEVMITMAVVVMVMGGFIGTNIAIRRASESAFERGVALQDANQVIEMMRNTAATGTFPTNVTAVYTNGGQISGFSNMTSETVTVSYVNAASNPLDATVTVAWKENGTTRNVNTILRSYITQRT